MASDAIKIQIFLKLLQETSIATEHQQPLIALANQLTDDDEKNVALIENWLTTANLFSLYQQQLKSVNPLLGKTGEKGGFRSQAKSNENSQCLKDVIIEQATKKNTNLPPDSSTSSEGKS